MCPSNYTCLPDIGDNPNFGYTSFDHFGWAMLTSCQLITLDFWEDTYNKVWLLFMVPANNIVTTKYVINSKREHIIMSKYYVITFIFVMLQRIMQILSQPTVRVGLLTLITINIIYKCMIVINIIYNYLPPENIFGIYQYWWYQILPTRFSERTARRMSSSSFSLYFLDHFTS